MVWKKSTIPNCTTLTDGDEKRTTTCITTTTSVTLATKKTRTTATTTTTNTHRSSGNNVAAFLSIHIREISQFLLLFTCIFLIRQIYILKNMEIHDNNVHIDHSLISNIMEQQHPRQFLDNRQRTTTEKKTDTKKNSNASSSLSSQSSLDASSSLSNSLSTLGTLEPNQTENKDLGSNKNKNNNNNNNAPYVLLHIGPHKTATTSLQKFLREDENNKDVEKLLLKDNFVIPHYRDMPGNNFEIPDFNFAHCMINGYTNRGGEIPYNTCKKKVIPAIKRFANRTFQRGNNILIVCEDLDRLQINHDRIKETFSPYYNNADNNTNIKIVITYRRLQDWLPSWYTQIIHLYWKRYVKENDLYFPSFVSYFDNRSERFVKRHALGLTNFYRRSFDGNNNIQIMNFHQKDDTKNNITDIYDNFFCNTLNLPHTCKGSKKLRKYHSRPRDSMLVQDFYRLWVVATRKGLSGFAANGTTRSLTASRYVRWRMIPAFEQQNKNHETVFGDMPYTCVSDEKIDSMLDATLEYEKTFLTDWFLEESRKESTKNNNSNIISTGGSVFKERMKRGLKEEMKSNFCSLDVHRVIQNETLMKLLFTHAATTTPVTPTASTTKTKTKTQAKKTNTTIADKQHKKRLANTNRTTTATTTNSVFSATKNQTEPVLLQKHPTATLCLVAKNPQKYIDEWADYHFAIGFTKLRIFDNSPEFNLKEWGKDKPYANQIKTTHYIPNTVHNITDRKEQMKQQERAYFECVREAVAENVTWVADFDIDEFLVLKKHPDVQEFMRDTCPPPCGQVSVNWVVFGSQNRTRYVSAPVTQRFRYVDRPTMGVVKVLVDPQAVDPVFPWWIHTFPLKKGRTWMDPNGRRITNQGWKRMVNNDGQTNIAALYHYRILSEEEWNIKNCERGDLMFKKHKQKACNTTPTAVGTKYDDAAWQALRRVVPEYQKYDNATDLG